MIQNNIGLIMLLNFTSLTHEEINLPKERMSMSSLATDDSCLKEKKSIYVFISIQYLFKSTLTHIYVTLIIRHDLEFLF